MSPAPIIWDSLKVADFNAPTAAPASPDQHDRWQSANRSWWESHPMRYDWRHPVPGEPGELEWFREIDRRLFEATVIPQGLRPFEHLLPRAAFAGKNVLEVGVGMGCHAQLLAEAAQEFTGIDLSQPAVAATRRRLQLSGSGNSTVLQMDAEKLAFPDAAFDLVWTWGVIHHTANTRRALEEIRRVLKPDGRALVMVYHRALVPWLLHAGLVRGIVRGELIRSRGIHRLVQGFTDGALARYYSISDWRCEIAGLFEAESVEIYGNRGEVLPLPAGRMKDALTSHIPEFLLRFWLTTCRQGTLLFSRLRPLSGVGWPAESRS
jgi:SAM-dependent methyltransferase